MGGGRTSHLNPMKTRILFGLALLAATPFGAVADHSTDRRIEEAAKSSYNFRKVLDQKVDISVRDGVATLTGTAPTDDQRRIAEDTVAGMDGVTRVDNKLRVEGGGREGSDEWIALKIRTRLAMKPHVSMTKTDVQVKDGVVTLTGTTDSKAQKELTESYAKEVQGVRSVDNRLQVVEPSQPARVRDEPTPTGRTDDRETVGEKIDDGSITAHIKYELFASPGARGLKTKVDTRDGNVVLTGEAKNEAEKDLATKLARSVRGVRSVDNRMTVTGR